MSFIQDYNAGILQVWFRVISCNAEIQVSLSTWNWVCSFQNDQNLLVCIYSLFLIWKLISCSLWTWQKAAGIKIQRRGPQSNKSETILRGSTEKFWLGTGGANFYIVERNFSWPHKLQPRKLKRKANNRDYSSKRRGIIKILYVRYSALDRIFLVLSPPFTSLAKWTQRVI